MNATHKEIIIWALSDETVRERLGVHLKDVLGVGEEALNNIILDLKNNKYQAGYLWGTNGDGHSVREFDTFAEAMAYDYGVIDATGYLKHRELNGIEIDFLEDCNPCCNGCETRDPQKFAAFGQWQRGSEEKVDITLDLCDECAEKSRIEAQKWWSSGTTTTLRRAVYTAVADQFDMIAGVPNYIPCLAVEGEPGYYPMRGSGEGSTPWYWGTTYEECQKTCDEYNEEHFGISPREAAVIVAGTSVVTELEILEE
jgi:hypothetical protein